MLLNARPLRLGAALAAVTTLLFPAPIAIAQPRAVGGAECNRMTGYDTIVVGAGIAGLSAAKELRRLGHSVLILEANDRIGGRGFVGLIGEERVPIDYGGAWLHGVPTNPPLGPRPRPRESDLPPQRPQRTPHHPQRRSDSGSAVRRRPVHFRVASDAGAIWTEHLADGRGGTNTLPRPRRGAYEIADIHAIPQGSVAAERR
jgi:choline dehydrogenase-like flavoprotein